MESRNLNLWYGDNHALKDISIGIPENQITALIGPSGCGKSTFIRCLNRMNDLVDIVRIEGEILYNGVNIYDRETDVVELRKNIGMYFRSRTLSHVHIRQHRYGHEFMGEDVDKIVEESLEKAPYGEISDRSIKPPWASRRPAARLCIARPCDEADVIPSTSPAAPWTPLHGEDRGADGRAEGVVHQVIVTTTCSRRLGYPTTPPTSSSASLSSSARRRRSSRIQKEEHEDYITPFG